MRALSRCEATAHAPVPARVCGLVHGQPCRLVGHRHQGILVGRLALMQDSGDGLAARRNQCLQVLDLALEVRDGGPQLVRLGINVGVVVGGGAPHGLNRAPLLHTQQA